MVKTNYVTEEQFKQTLKEVVEKGQGVWYLMGYLQGMFGLRSDTDTTDLMHQLIVNSNKENKQYGKSTYYRKETRRYLLR